MARIIGLWLLLVGGWELTAAEGPLYRMDFQGVDMGKVPDGMLVLDGGFAVQQEGEARFLELPGDPLETYGVLFGPAQTNDVAVAARGFGTARGRRYPSFGVGLGGANGYKLRLSPGKKELELHKGDTRLSGVPFDWQSGRWTCFRLQIRSAGPGWRVEAKAWTEGAPEPASWVLAHDEAEAPRPGRAAIWAAPFAGTPIRFDDLILSRATPAP